MAAPIQVLSKVLPVLFAEPVKESVPNVTNEDALSKLNAGIPLLRDEAIQIDAKSFARRWHAICDAVAQHHPDRSASKFSDALRQGELRPNKLLGQILSGRSDQVRSQAIALGLDPGLSATVLRLSLFPVLSHVNRQLLPVRQHFGWRHGFCPTCGSWPLLGESRGLEQLRLLRCGLCSAEWEFSRLECPFCGTREHNVLGYFNVEGEETRFRASTCDQCRGYVKIASTLEALTGPRLLVTDVATMHLDLLAAERGYAVEN